MTERPPLNPEPPIPTSLSRVGDFTIVREIGRGGMGVVYEATQSGMERRVALKVLPASLGSDAVSRFEREAKAAGSLKHPGIVPVFAFGEDRGLHYIAMEYVEGPTLDVLIEQASERALAGTPDASPSPDTSAETPTDGSTPAPGDAIRTGRPDGRHYILRAAELFAGTARALAAAHLSGIVHRDIKPSNLILDPSGHLRLLDFGLARASDMGRITHTGETIGTPRYLAPESIDSKAADPDQRSDVYSLGMTLYETVTRQPAFDGDSTEEILLKVLNDEPARPRSLVPALPRDLETIILRATAKRPNDRYPDAAALADDLERFAQGLPPRARRMGPVTRSMRWVGRHKPAVAVISLVAVLIGLLAFLVWKNAESNRTEELAEAMAAGHHYLSSGAAANADDELSPTDRVQMAADYFSSAIRIDKAHAEAWFYRAICAVELGDPKQAAADLRAALASAPGFHAARVLLADLLRREGDAEGAEALLAQLPPGANNAPRPETLYYEGRALLYAKAPTDAYQRFDAALAANLTDNYLKYRAYLGRGDAAMILGDRVQALEDYSAARTLRGETPEVMLKLARLHFVQNRPAKAIACLHAVAPDEENRAQPFMRVADLLRSLGKTKEALAWVEKAIKRAPKDPDPLAQRAHLLLQIGRPKEALGAASAALERSARHVRAAEAKARAQLRLNKASEAVQTLQWACEVAPHDNRVARWLARANIRVGDHKAALAASKRALQNAPRDIDARLMMAESLYRRGKKQAAISAVEDLAKQTRSHPYLTAEVENRLGTKPPARFPAGLAAGFSAKSSAKSSAEAVTKAATKAAARSPKRLDDGAPSHSAPTATSVTTGGAEAVAPGDKAGAESATPAVGTAKSTRGSGPKTPATVRRIVTGLQRKNTPPETIFLFDPDSKDGRVRRRPRTPRNHQLLIRRITRQAERAARKGNFERCLTTTAFLAATGARRAPEFAIALGRHAKTKAEYARAAETMLSAYRNYPQHADLAYHLGRCYVMAGNQPSLDRLLARLAASKKPSVLGAHAGLLALAGRDPQALAALDRARAAGWKKATKRYPALARIENARQSKPATER